jgi:hypothetical protein
MRSSTDEDAIAPQPECVGASKKKNEGDPDFENPPTLFLA